EHQVEWTRLGPIDLAAVRASNSLPLKPVFRLRFCIKFVGLANMCARLPKLFQKLVFSKAALTRAAIDHRIGEGFFMTGIFPEEPVLDYRRVDPLYIVPLINDPVPPTFLDVVRQLYTERPVIPGGTQASVDFRSRKNKTTTFRERDNSFYIRCSHKKDSAFRF